MNREASQVLGRLVANFDITYAFNTTQATFSKISARCARRHILYQISGNPALSQSVLLSLAPVPVRARGPSRLEILHDCRESPERILRSLTMVHVPLSQLVTNSD